MFGKKVGYKFGIDFADLLMVQSLTDSSNVINDIEGTYNKLREKIQNGLSIHAFTRCIGRQKFISKKHKEKVTLLYSLILKDFGPRDDSYYFDQEFFDIVYNYGVLVSPISHTDKPRKLIFGL